MAGYTTRRSTTRQASGAAFAAIRSDGKAWT